MRSLLTIMLLVAVMLPASSQAQTISICQRTPQVRDAILQALEADDCAAVDSQRLASLEVLCLRENQLTSLRAGDFAGLTGLEHLRLDFNQLTTLQEVLFDGLGSLEVLYLGGNQLTALPVGAFNGLGSLRNLDLGYNQLAGLQEGLFGSLTSLEVLGLGGNQLTTLQAGLFDELASLEWLDLKLNHLVGLTDNDSLFAGLPDVFVQLGGQTEAPVSEVTYRSKPWLLYEGHKIKQEKRDNAGSDQSR